MNTEQILKVLKNERECINTERKGKCNYHCKNCQYRNSNTDKLEVLDFLINGYELLQNEGAESYTIKCKEPLSEELKAYFGIKQPGKVMAEFWEKGNTAPDVTARAIFNGICPYTNIKCEEWTCSTCKIEARERAFAKGDTD